jgi:hypothetical protein
MRRHGRLDPEELRHAQVDRATLQRAGGFVRAYRGHLIAYLATIVLAALVGTLPRRALSHSARADATPS